MQAMDIVVASESEFDALTCLWEDAVRTTHDFLAESDIAWLRPRIRGEYLPAVSVRIAKDAQGNIRGFVGVADGKVEMLFVASAARGMGIGRKLLQHAIEEMGARLLDVNEQNPQAAGFYRHMGFEIIGRSPTDGMGKPFPLLHMRLMDIS